MKEIKNEIFLQNFIFFSILENQMMRQTFPIIYKSRVFKVDPICLSKSSRKFNELYETYIKDNQKNNSFQLGIQYDSFSERNVENFLKLCQNLPTDVQDSEMEEICTIAKLFQADKIYEVGVDFIHKSIDPNFSVSDNFFNDSNSKKYLFLEREPIESKENETETTDSEFDSSTSGSDSVFSSQNQTSEDIKNLPAYKPNSSENIQSKENNSHTKTTYINTIRILPVVKSALYTIHVDHHIMKHRHFTCVKDSQVCLSAKQKKKVIVVASGPFVHLHHHYKNQNNYVSKIVQSNGWYNTVENSEQTFVIRYTPGFKSKQALMNVSFLFKGTLFSWISEDPNCQNTANLYNQKLVGVYHRIPIKSKKNIILRNSNNDTTFILRKMDKGTFEVECHPDLPVTIAFAIAISDIVGPYHDIETSFK